MLSEQEYIEFLTDGRVVNRGSYEVTIDGLNTEVISCYLPIGNSREGKFQTPHYIVIHETSIGVEKAPEYKNIKYYTNKLMNDKDNVVAFHYLCSDNRIVQFIPDFEVAYHSGTKLNYRSIGIERLVNEKINFPDALHNQAKLVATLMYKWRIPLHRVISHKNARIAVETMPKECPARMLDFQYGGEDAFLKEIVYCVRNKDFFHEVLDVSLSIIEEGKKRK